MDLPDRLRALARWQPHADIAMAAVLLTVTLVATSAGPHPAVPQPLGVVSAVVACGVLVGRRRWPYPTFTVSALAAEIYLAGYQGHEGVTVLAAPLIALYSAAERGANRRHLVIGVGAVLSLSAVHMLRFPGSWLGAGNLALAALGALAIAAGEAARNRRAYLAEVEARAADAERDRDAAAARRVAVERLRIARDLHDAVGHQLALIAVQAGVAEHMLDSRPDQSREALGYVRRAARTALDELRDTVGLLREPTPSLDLLPALLDSFRRSGLDLRFHADGDAPWGVDGETPPAVGITMYRVIQEALTNARKHAASGPVTVDLAHRPDGLSVTIANATTAGPARGGYGLLGMRERVAAAGGGLEAGADSAGMFRVSVYLPIPDSDRRPRSDRERR